MALESHKADGESANGRPAGAFLLFLPILLACAWPFVQFYNQNRTESDDWQTLLVGFALAASAAALLYGVIRLVFRSTDGVRHANLLLVLCLLFFNYNAFDILLRDILAYPQDEHGFVKARYVLALWTVSALLAAGLTWWLARRRAWIVLTTVVAVALAMSVVQLSFGLATEDRSRELAQATTAAEEEGFVRRPNIYFFLLDAYARHDVLTELGGFDNQPFLAAMAERGFLVASDSYANYPKTFLSLGSTFDMDYLAPAGEGTVAPKTSYHVLLSGNNRTIQRLKQNGYRFLMAARSTSNCIGYQDVCVRGDRDFGLVTVGELEINLLQMTPLLVVINRFLPELVKFEDIFPEVVKASILRDVYGPEAPTEVPAFYFYHNVSAHGSQYAEGCDRASLYDRPRKAVHKTETIPAYLISIECLNEKFLDLTDTILQRDPEAVIIIQSDHGVALDEWRDYEDWSEQDFQYRFGVLNLMRLPEDCRDALYPTISPVNTFRLVFACLANEPASLLSDESYWVDKFASDRVVLWRVHER